MTTVVVLAGGASNRFWPLIDKPLIRFGAGTLLDRHLAMLREAGATRFVVVARPENAATIREMAPTANDLTVVVQPEARGMADALLHARAAIEFGPAGPIYITQAQDIVEPGLHRALLAPGALDAADAVIAAAEVTSYFPGGYLSVAGDRITSIVEKPGAGNEPSNVVNIVAHLFRDPALLFDRVSAEAAAGGADDAYERALGNLMGEWRFRPFVYRGRWEAIKYPWHLLDAMAMVLEGWQSASESPGAGYTLREDGVVIGDNVRIFPGAHVVAPAFLDHDVVVGHNALVRGSYVGRAAVVGFGSEVARSYLGAGVQLHHNYIGDSVLGDGTSLGFGGTTANFRVDGRLVPSLMGSERIDTGREKLGLIAGAGVRVGVNTSTMPGIKIGAGAIVGPNLVINRDVPAGLRVLNQADYDRLAGA